jgi:hypothetical protein
MKRGSKSACLRALLWVLPACSRQRAGPESSGEKPSQSFSRASVNLAPDLSTRPEHAFQATFTNKVVNMEQAEFVKSIRRCRPRNRATCRLVAEPRGQSEIGYGDNWLQQDAV